MRWIMPVSEHGKRNFEDREDTWESALRLTPKFVVWVPLSVLLVVAGKVALSALNELGK